MLKKPSKLGLCNKATTSYKLRDSQPHNWEPARVQAGFTGSLHQPRTVNTINCNWP